MHFLCVVDNTKLYPGYQSAILSKVCDSRVEVKEVSVDVKSGEEIKILKVSESTTILIAIKKDLQDYHVIYTTTPQSTTGKISTELCYGRTIMGKIPLFILLKVWDRVEVKKDIGNVKSGEKIKVLKESESATILITIEMICKIT